MNHAPAAEIEFSPSLAQRLIDSQFPALAPSRAVLLGTGWDNWAFAVNDAYVFRFPRRQAAAPLVAAEMGLLPLIAGRVPLPVPIPRFRGSGGPQFPWPFFGYPRLPGGTACSARLDEMHRRDAARPLAEFLRALHAIPAELAARAGAAPDDLGRFDVSRRAALARRQIEACAASGLIGDSHRLLAILDAAPAGYVPRSDTLVHGDLYARHLLVDDTGRLSAVIDWSDAHLGDPAADLAIAHTFLPPDARPAFRRVYGPIDDPMWAAVRFRALYHTLTLCLYAHEVADAALAAESARSLQYLSCEG